MEEAEKHLAKELLCSGINLFLSGEYEQAEERLKEALELDSEAGLAYCYLGYRFGNRAHPRSVSLV